MSKYASKTTVSPEKSQSEIYSILRKYGATKFGAMEDVGKAYLFFEFNGLLIRVDVPLPDISDFELTASGRTRTNEQAKKEHEQSIKQRWRALLLAVKAKLESVEVGISTIEKEFMSFVVMPDGRQLSDHVVPKLNEISSTGKMPKLLV